MPSLHAVLVHATAVQLPRLVLSFAVIAGLQKYLLALITSSAPGTAPGTSAAPFEVPSATVG